MRGTVLTAIVLIQTACEVVGDSDIVPTIGKTL